MLDIVSTLRLRLAFCSHARRARGVMPLSSKVRTSGYTFRGKGSNRDELGKHDSLASAEFFITLTSFLLATSYFQKQSACLSSEPHGLHNTPCVTMAATTAIDPAKPVAMATLPEVGPGSEATVHPPKGTQAQFLQLSDMIHSPPRQTQFSVQLLMSQPLPMQVQLQTSKIKV